MKITSIMSYIVYPKIKTKCIITNFALHLMTCREKNVKFQQNFKFCNKEIRSGDTHLNRNRENLNHTNY